MEKRKRIKEKIAIVLIYMFVLIFGNCLVVGAEELSIIKEEYSNERGKNDIQIFYPKIQGLDDEGWIRH